MFFLNKRVVSLKAEIAAYERSQTSVGTVIQDLHLRDISGEPNVLLTSDENKATLIYVFTPQCIWCARNLANIQALAKQAENRPDLRVIGVSLTRDGLSDYMRRTNLAFPVYTDLDKSEITRLGLGSTPETLLVSNHIVTNDWRGAYSVDMRPQIEKRIGVHMPGLLEVMPPHTVK